MFNRALLAAVFSVGLIPSAFAQTCPTTTPSTPAFTAGGSLFGRIASQWNQYFNAKADANNGTLCNPTILGTINLTFAQITAALGYVPTNSATLLTPHTYLGNNTTSSAPAAQVTNVQVAADLPAVVGDSGSGGTKGSVPAPAAGDAAANKKLGANGAWISPAIGDYTLQQLYNVMIEPQGRLTLTTGTPVLTSTVSGATTIFYSPMKGSLVPFYDGTRWTVLACGELSNVTTASSVGSAGPAAVAASSNYDLFVWNNAGACTLTRSAAWTNNTTRSNTLVRQDGLWLNSTTITNGPAASRGTYVGSVCSNGSSTIDYVFGGAASGGTAARFCVYNAYNMMLTQTTVTDNGGSYTYSSATTRQARASAGNQIAFMNGLPFDGTQYAYTKGAVTVAAAGADVGFGVGLDSTTTFVNGRNTLQGVGANTFTGSNTNAGSVSVNTGLHTLSANEFSDGANANTFDGFFTPALTAIIRN